MAIGYVSDKTTKLFKSATGDEQVTVLIFGDEVERTGPVQNGREGVTFRKKMGFVNQAELGSAPALEMYFIDVGQGDAAFIVTPERRKILVDGGPNHRALGFLTWKYRLDLEDAAPIDIDLLIMSHGDRDHLDGLVPIISHPLINVKRILHNGLAVFDDSSLSEKLGVRSGDFIVTRYSALADLPAFTLSAPFSAWRRAIEGEAAPPVCQAVDTRTAALDLEPFMSMEFLGPRLETINGSDGYRWFGDHGHTINGHSVVVRLKYKDVSVLFSGDLNKKGSEHLLPDQPSADRFDAHVFKAPHHGSGDYSLKLFDAVRPQVSVVSSGDAPDHGHPRAVFLGALGQHQRSDEPLLFATEIAATFQEEPTDRGTETSLIGLDPRDPADRRETRVRFKRRLHGMINVRTDGNKIYAARRVMTGYKFESYEQVAVPRTDIVLAPVVPA